MVVGAFCHLVDFIIVSNTQLQFKDVSFDGSLDWNKLRTMVSKEFNTIVNRHY